MLDELVKFPDYEEIQNKWILTIMGSCNDDEPIQFICRSKENAITLCEEKFHIIIKDPYKDSCSYTATVDLGLLIFIEKVEDTLNNYEMKCIRNGIYPFKDKTVQEWLKEEFSWLVLNEESIDKVSSIWQESQKKQFYTQR